MQERNDKLFVKLYLRARDSGLLAAIGDRDWRTLCVLAMYMNQDGWCNPSQMSLARSLGISRSSVARRIQHLRRFRFNGQPVIQTESQNRDQHGTFGRTSYRILPSSNLAIFFSHSDKKRPS